MASYQDNSSNDLRNFNIDLTTTPLYDDETTFSTTSITYVFAKGFKINNLLPFKNLSEIKVLITYNGRVDTSLPLGSYSLRLNDVEIDTNSTASSSSVIYTKEVTLNKDDEIKLFVKSSVDTETVYNDTLKAELINVLQPNIIKLDA